MTGPLILASGSVTRRQMLERAGVPVEVDPAGIDEAELKARLKADRASVERSAATLADAKARMVALRRPGALVLGADQILECQGTWHDKPADRDGAKAQLLALAGRRHRLITSAVVLRDEKILWQVTDIARLLMRPFGEAFVEDYLDRGGSDLLASVGAYQLEGLGAQLFEDVEGDFFTILGLPLLPLLDFLRGEGVVPT